MNSPVRMLSHHCNKFNCCGQHRSYVCLYDWRFFSVNIFKSVFATYTCNVIFLDTCCFLLLG